MAEHFNIEEATEQEQKAHVDHIAHLIESQGISVESRVSLACALGLHNWNGTKKCANCGATRG